MPRFIVRVDRMEHKYGEVEVEAEDKDAAIEKVIEDKADEYANLEWVVVKSDEDWHATEVKR